MAAYRFLVFLHHQTQPFHWELGMKNFTLFNSLPHTAGYVYLELRELFQSYKNSDASIAKSSKLESYFKIPSAFHVSSIGSLFSSFTGAGTNIIPASIHSIQHIIPIHTYMYTHSTSIYIPPPHTSAALARRYFFCFSKRQKSNSFANEACFGG